MIKIGFLGYGTRGLDCLMAHPMFDVRYFLVPGSRLCQDVFHAQEKYKDHLEMEIVYDNRQLAARFAAITDVDCFLMNACPIILNKEVLSQMRVFNIHPGDLRYNRGHQPHCWTVLLGERQTKIVLHTVTEKIDSGWIIKSVDVPVLADDSAEDVLIHAEDQIPILLDALYKHLTEHTEYEMAVENGKYRRVMTYDDYEIHLSIDTREQMMRKILSRMTYHGAFFRYVEKRIYVDAMLAYKEYTERQDCAITVGIESEKNLVHVHSIWRSMIFHINKSERIGGFV